MIMIRDKNILYLFNVYSVPTWTAVLKERRSANIRSYEIIREWPSVIVVVDVDVVDVVVVVVDVGEGGVGSLR